MLHHQPAPLCVVLGVTISNPSPPTLLQARALLEQAARDVAPVMARHKLFCPLLSEMRPELPNALVSWAALAAPAGSWLSTLRGRPLTRPSSLDCYLLAGPMLAARWEEEGVPGSTNTPFHPVGRPPAGPPESGLQQHADRWRLSGQR